MNGCPLEVTSEKAAVIDIISYAKLSIPICMLKRINLECRSIFLDKKFLLVANQSSLKLQPGNLKSGLEAKYQL